MTSPTRRVKRPRSVLSTTAQPALSPLPTSPKIARAEVRRTTSPVRPPCAAFPEGEQAAAPLYHTQEGHIRENLPAYDPLAVYRLWLQWQRWSTIWFPWEHPRLRRAVCVTTDACGAWTAAALSAQCCGAGRPAQTVDPLEQWVAYATAHCGSPRLTRAVASHLFAEDGQSCSGRAGLHCVLAEYTTPVPPSQLWGRFHNLLVSAVRVQTTVAQRVLAQVPPRGDLGVSVSDTEEDWHRWLLRVVTKTPWRAHEHRVAFVVLLLQELASRRQYGLLAATLAWLHDVSLVGSTVPAAPPPPSLCHDVLAYKGGLPFETLVLMDDVHVLLLLHNHPEPELTDYGNAEGLQRHGLWQTHQLAAVERAWFNVLLPAAVAASSGNRRRAPYALGKSVAAASTGFVRRLQTRREAPLPPGVPTEVAQRTAPTDETVATPCVRSRLPSNCGDVSPPLDTCRREQGHPSPLGLDSLLVDHATTGPADALPPTPAVRVFGSCLPPARRPPRPFTADGEDAQLRVIDDATVMLYSSMKRCLYACHGGARHTPETLARPPISPEEQAADAEVQAEEGMLHLSLHSGALFVRLASEGKLTSLRWWMGVHEHLWDIALLLREMRRWQGQALFARAFTAAAAAGHVAVCQWLWRKTLALQHGYVSAYRTSRLQKRQPVCADWLRQYQVPRATRPLACKCNAFLRPPHLLLAFREAHRRQHMAVCTWLVQTQISPEAKSLFVAPSSVAQYRCECRRATSAGAAAHK